MKNTFSKLVLAGLFLFTANVIAQDYDWGALLRNNDAWFATNAQAVTVGNSIIQHQLADGGWRKDPSTTSGEWAKSTVDNDATTSQIIFLARLYKARNTASYLTSLQRGIDLLISGQYANGGWPQIFGAGASTYHAHITFNDNAMIKIMEVLFDVSLKRNHFTFIDDTRASRAKTAVDRGVECILRAQIIFTNGDTTAWCQQHDRSTLAPAGGRAYELPSVSGSESVGIVNFLKTYLSTPGNTTRADVARSINAAIRWLDRVKIVGIRVNNVTTNGSPDRVVVSDPSSTLWARFYQVNTARPIFVGRDGVVRYNLADIEQERRAGYAYYGTWPRNLIAAGLVTVPNTGPVTGTLIGSGANFIDSLRVFNPANASNWSLQTNLRPQQRVYGDREFVTGTIPALLQGAEWISPAMNTRTATSPDTLVRFRMRRAGTVYVAHEDRISPRPAWLASRGFTATSTRLTVNDGSADRTFTVYSRTAAQNQVIALGPNSNDGTSTSMMYLVAVRDGATSVLDRTQLSSYELKISPAKKGGAVNVNYAVKESGAVRLDLFDIKGNRVRTLSHKTKDAGTYNERFSTNGLAKGMYLVKLRAGSQTLQERVLITR